MATAQITLKIPAELLHKRGVKELVVMDKKEYEKELKQRKELADALQMVRQGEQELREGKTIVARGLSEAMKKYARKKH